MRGHVKLRLLLKLIRRRQRALFAVRWHRPGAALLWIRRPPGLVKKRAFIFLALVTALAGACSRRSEPVAIEPSVAVGAVHSGMTIQQVIAELGQPDQTNDSHFQYSRLGLTVVPGRGEAVERVTIAHPFTGRTKENIGIGSSRADVIRAYGAPTVAKPGTPGYDFLRYRRLGLVFQLHDGKVDVMSVIFQTTK